MIDGRGPMNAEEAPMTPLCEHFDTGVEVAPPLAVCQPCTEIGGTWFHLRQCLVCGQTSCCDRSPNRHATAHWRQTGHAMMRSAEPGEPWRWCYEDELLFIPGAHGFEVAED
jgi:CPA2 family monovalent cation:H+ antiporter-2